MINGYIFTAILVSAMVTWIPRVLPFVLVKYRGLPPIVERFLQYLPVSIIFALILSGITEVQAGRLPSFRWLDTIALLPTTYIAFRYRNLVWTVLIGVVCIAFLRFIF